MVGQGAIIAVGTIDYPAEYQGTAPEMRATLGISKVMTLTCTYDHRIIQGAESGMFLGKLQALLDGEDGFYEEIFEHLKLPYKPVRWEPDRQVSLPRRFRAHGRGGQGSRGDSDDQRVSRARPPDGGSRSAGRRAALITPSWTRRHTA